MIEVGRLPRRCRVTLAALTGEVIGRFVIRMARDAVGLPGVIKVRRLPCRRRVTIAALPGEVIWRRIICVT